MSRTLRRVPWLHAAFCAGVSIAGASTAIPSPPTEADLQREAQLEGAQVDSAVLARLERERAGDMDGARIAERDAQLHRERFLAITRDLEHLLSPLPPSLSATAAGTSGTTMPVLTRKAHAVTPEGGTRIEPVRSAQPSRPWDMYRPHELQRVADERDTDDLAQASRSRSATPRTPTAGDLYASHPALALGERAETAGGPVARAGSASVRSPFLVYRLRPALHTQGDSQQR